jgi:glucokinase
VSTLTIGVDVGGTKVLGGVVDEDGITLAQARRDTPANDPGQTLDAIVAVVTDLAARPELAGQEVVGVGVGAAGWIDEKRSRVLFAPNLAWRDEPLRERLTQRLPYPVVVENDANAAAWAEFRFGAARAATGSAALLTIGTGIGGGIVIGGQVVRGAFGVAGEPGHMRAVPDGRACPCGRHGCLEQYASGNALLRTARERASADPAGASQLLTLAGGTVEQVTGLHVTAAARMGDPVAVAAFAEVGSWLGTGLADLAYLLDPEIMVIGGGVVDAGELLLAPTRAAYQEQLGTRKSLPVAAVVPATLGSSAGFVGAADLARR